VDPVVEDYCELEIISGDSNEWEEPMDENIMFGINY